MNLIFTDDYLYWLGEQTRARYTQREFSRLVYGNFTQEEDMGRHSPPEETNVFNHRGYQCEACKGYWAALEPEGADQPEELPCLATEGCEGPVVALYPVEEAPPEWIPVIIQGGRS